MLKVNIFCHRDADFGEFRAVCVCQPPRLCLALCLPGVAGMGLFVLFPLICTIAIAFTNYSSTNQLTFERAQSVLLDRQFQTGKTFTFGLYPSDNQWRLQLTNPDDGSLFISEPFSFEATGEQK